MAPSHDLPPQETGLDRRSRRFWMITPAPTAEAGMHNLQTNRFRKNRAPRRNSPAYRPSKLKRNQGFRVAFGGLFQREQECGRLS